MKKNLVEFIGTFFLVFTVGMAIRAGGPLAPFAIAAVLTSMVFAGGYYSGGHYNPAVTLAVFVRRRIELSTLLSYWVAQVAAAVVAALLVNYLTGAWTQGPANPPMVPSLIVEFLFTFALCWVVLNVATAKGTSGNSFYGLGIGFTVLAGAVSVGAISGGAFNPAVGVGVVMMGYQPINQLIVYVIANLLGAVVAALAFRVVNEGHD